MGDKLSRPKYLRYAPKGFDRGENGQHNVIQARTLKANQYDKAPEALEPDQVAAALDACRNPRDVLLIRVLHDVGLRRPGWRTRPVHGYSLRSVMIEPGSPMPAG